MTNRLPTPGYDDGTWGTILNDFLDVSHNSDGTLANNSVGTNQIQAGAITNAQLDSTTQAAIASVASKYTKPAGGIPSTDLDSSVQTNLTAASTAVQSVNSKTGTAVTITAADVSAIPSSQLGAASGVAMLDATGNVPANQLGNVPNGGGGSNPAVVALGNVTGATNIDLSTGICFTATLTGDATFTFSNWPTGLVEPLLILTQDATGGHAITLTGVSWLPSGVSPTFDTTAGDVNYIPLSSTDQGATIYGESGSANTATLQDQITNLQNTIADYSTLESNVATLQDNVTNALYVVEQGSDSGVARPNVPGKVLWVGSATPDNRNAGDLQATDLTVLDAGLPRLIQSVASFGISSANSTAVPLTSLPTVGHTLILSTGASVGGIDITSIDDPAGNTWTVDYSYTSYNSLNFARTTVENAYQDGDELTINWSAFSGNGHGGVAEFTTLPANPVDQTSGNFSNTGVTSGNAGTTPATSEAIEIVVSMVAHNASGGITLQDGFQGIAYGGGPPYTSFGYLVTSIAGAQTLDFTFGTSGNYTAALLCYKTS